MHKWDKRFLDLAAHISTWSKDPSTKVGAVIVDSHNRIVSTGYNGFASGLDDNLDLYLNREYKLNNIIHAEENAIIMSTRDLKGCVLYTYPFLPCSKCSNLIINKFITKVVSYKTQEQRWLASINNAINNFKQANIEIIQYELDKPK